MALNFGYWFVKYWLVDWRIANSKQLLRTLPLFMPILALTARLPVNLRVLFFDVMMLWLDGDR